MASASVLLAETHGALPRLLAEGANSHFEGPQKATRYFLRQRRLSQKLAGRSMKLEMAFHICRHITSPSCASLLTQVQEDLQGKGKILEVDFGKGVEEAKGMGKEVFELGVMKAKGLIFDKGEE